MSENGAINWDELVRREMPVRPGYEWLRCQVGRIIKVRADPKYPADAVFVLLGFGRTPAEAEEMMERKFGR